MRTGLFFSLAFLLITSCTVAQPGRYQTDNKKAIKLYEEASTCFRDIDPTNGQRRSLDCAEENALKAIEKDDQFIDALLLMAQVRIEQGNLKEAIDYKEKVLQINPEYSVNELYYISTLAISIGDYEKCLRYSKMFLTRRNTNEVFQDVARRNVENCEFAIEALKNPVHYDPKNLGSNINTDRPEYFPTLTADDKTLLFTRTIEDERVPIYGAQEDFYITTWEDSEWSPSYGVGDPINTKYNEGAPTFSADGKYVIFVGCETGFRGERNYGENRQGYGSCDLFVSERVGSKWTEPFNLGKPINSGHWESQPCFSADGKSLYFIRGIVRQGRKNPEEQDIYVTRITDQGWSVPEKLPSTVNTPYREESVMIHPDGQTLYFSSNGHPGMGGLDIFMSRKNAKGEWGKAVNLGYPINTYKNENSLLVSAKGDLAFFASDRDGGFGSLDLYSFLLPEKFRPVKTTYVKGKVYDAVTKEHLAAQFKLVDLETGEVVKEAVANSGNGEFLVALPVNKDYALYASHEGYLFFSENYSLTSADLADKEFAIEVPMEKDVIVLENVFFDVDSYKLKPKSTYELDKVVDFLKSNPSLKVELGGHTDSDGDDKSNQILSENRAKACVEYITSKGIDRDRLSFKGYGEARPRVANDTPENKAKNRRTELKILN